MKRKISNQSDLKEAEFSSQLSHIRRLILNHVQEYNELEKAMLQFELYMTLQNLYKTLKPKILEMRKRCTYAIRALPQDLKG